jgi:hypothetical protein
MMHVRTYDSIISTCSSGPRGSSRCRAKVSVFRNTCGILLTIAAFLTGCAVQPTQGVVSPPELQISFSPELSLPDDCRPAPGHIYRAEFIVQADGRVGDVKSTGELPCARAALERWAAGLRYEPPREATATVVDWMLVEGKRGG